MHRTDQSSYSDDQVQVRHVTSGARRTVHSDHSTPVTRLKSRSRTSRTPIHQQVEKERTHRGVRKPVTPHISLNEVKPKVTALIYFLQALQTIFSKFIFITIIFAFPFVYQSEHHKKPYIVCFVIVLTNATKAFYSSYHFCLQILLLGWVLSVIRSFSLYVDCLQYKLNYHRYLQRHPHHVSVHQLVIQPIHHTQLHKRQHPDLSYLQNTA